MIWYGKAPPGWGGVVGRMKLLAPNVGWADRGGRLYWTTDNGANWTDITPPATPGYDGNIADIFFLDAHHGWVLFGQCCESDQYGDRAKFDLASTSDTGASWSLEHVTLPRSDAVGLNAGGRIAFADDQHGWMVLSAGKGGQNAGSLFLTSDGGRTWREPPAEPGGGGPILMVTPKEGWMVGEYEEFADEELYVTRDGAKSWRKVSLPAPKEIYPAIYPTADVPVFEDDKHGFVAVTYSGGYGNKSAAVLFATDDGGRSWKPDRILANLEEKAVGQRMPSTVADSTWITGNRVPAHAPTLTALSAGARVRASIDPVSHFSGYFQVYQLSFATRTQGWIIVGDGELRSTTDGGATWTTLLPGPQPRVIQPHGSFIPRPSMGEPDAALAPADSVTNAALALNPSKHLGFDQYSVGPPFEMGKWWQYSPYHDVGFYPNGSANGHLDPNLSSSWVTAVSRQGWGLIPIWVGLQDHCACSQKGGVWPNCLNKNEHPYETFSADPFVAKTEGLLEASETVYYLNLLGITGGIVYKDLENYNDTSVACSSSAIYFLAGWIEEIRASGFKAGVYESASNGADLLIVQPDDVWIAQGNNEVSIWQLGNASKGYPFSDAIFTNHQRIHQYTKNIYQAWGGIPAWEIDNDIEDVQVLGGGGTKTMQTYNEYPFSLFVDCTQVGAIIANVPCSVNANGINNPQLYDTPTTPASTIGTIIGEIYAWEGGPFIPTDQMQDSRQLADASGTFPCDENSDPDGGTVSFDWGFETGYFQTPFPYVVGGTCFDWYGTTRGSTAGTGINNLTGDSGRIVGRYTTNNSDSPWYGCQASSQSPQVCSVPSVGNTQYIGINDVDWISQQTGPDANGNYTAGLVLSAGTSAVKEFAGMAAGGINGFGQMGYYSPYPVGGGIFDYNGGYSSGNVSTTAQIVGINNNNEAITGGGLIQEADTPKGAASSGLWAGNCPLMQVVSGINDWGQIVGSTLFPTEDNWVVFLGDVCIPATEND